MVQKGRGYRAARPRCNYNDLRYNQRCPMRWSIRGSVATIFHTYAFDGSQHTGECIYVPSGPTWFWLFSGGIFPATITVQVTLEWLPVEPCWRFKTRIENFAGDVYTTTWLYNSPGSTPSTPALYPYTTPTSEARDPGWLPGNTVRLSCLLYSEE